MPLRSRLRRAFTFGSQDSSDDLTKTSKTKQKSRTWGISSKPAKDKEEVYVHPPLKYRRPVAPEHKAHLESFEWSKAWRRRSMQSIYSPMGSRMPSRKNSYASLRRSLSRRRSRSSLARSDDLERDRDAYGSVVDSGVGMSVSNEERLEMLLKEGSDEEGDVTNVGLSRNATQDPRHSSNTTAGHRRTKSKRSVRSVRSTSRPETSEQSNALTKSNSRGEAQSPRPFSPEALDLALQKTKSNLEATKEESLESSPHRPALVVSDSEVVESDTVSPLASPAAPLAENTSSSLLSVPFRKRERRISFEDEEKPKLMA